MCCVDLGKVYDWVPWEIVWEMLWEYGLTGSLLRATQSLCAQSESCFWVLGSKLDLFLAGVGLHQGYTLSPILFMICMDRISRRSHGGVGLQSGGLKISSLLFADDMVPMASPVCNHQL